MRPILRLIDANANRASEAARVLEDLARFCLEDAELAETGKAIRHGVRTCLEALDPRTERVSHARDTENDPGTSISTDRESDRRGPREIALAAGSRLSEALRVLEETAKTQPGGQAPVIEALRYRSYTFAQRVAQGLAPACPQWTVCVLLSESLCAHRPWLEVARSAIRGGAGCLQLREKSLTDRELLSRARALVELARTCEAVHDSHVAVIINDRPDIAALSDADGVHLGQTDLSPANARVVVGGRWVGVSTASISEARAAVNAGADSVGLGPMFPSTTKPKDRLSGPEYLQAYLADPVLCSVPHLAISGINAGRAAELGALGCRGVAVSSEVCGAEDPGRAVADIHGALTGQRDR